MPEANAAAIATHGTYSVLIRANNLGGSALVEKVRRVAQDYGDETASRFLATLEGSDKMVQAYQARANVLAQPDASTNPNAINVVRLVNVAEEKILAAILTGEKGKATAPVRVGTVANYRDVDGEGGWSYRQYESGTIAVLDAPVEHAKAKGAVYRPTDTGSKAAIWKAITDEIGPFEGEQQQLPGATGGVPVADGGEIAELIGDMVGPRGKRVVRKAASVVSGLLAAAGVAANVPVAGLVVAGGIGLGAATILLVRAIRKRKNAAAVKRAARRYGLADAEAFPVLTVKALRASDEQLEKIAARLSARASRVGSARRARVEARLRIVATILLVRRAEARRRSKAPFGVAVTPTRAISTKTSALAKVPTAAVVGGLRGPKFAPIKPPKIGKPHFKKPGRVSLRSFGEIGGLDLAFVDGGASMLFATSAARAAAAFPIPLEAGDVPPDMPTGMPVAGAGLPDADAFPALGDASGGAGGALFATMRARSLPGFGAALGFGDASGGAGGALMVTLHPLARSAVGPIPAVRGYGEGPFRPFRTAPGCGPNDAPQLCLPTCRCDAGRPVAGPAGIRSYFLPERRTGAPACKCGYGKEPHAGKVPDGLPGSEVLV